MNHAGLSGSMWWFWYHTGEQCQETWMCLIHSMSYALIVTVYSGPASDLALYNAVTRKNSGKNGNLFRIHKFLTKVHFT